MEAKESDNETRVVLMDTVEEEEKEMRNRRRNSWLYRDPEIKLLTIYLTAVLFCVMSAGLVVVDLVCEAERIDFSGVIVRVLLFLVLAVAAVLISVMAGQAKQVARDQLELPAWKLGPIL